jgi:XTP/dITP diphosphohydrolase
MTDEENTIHFVTGNKNKFYEVFEIFKNKKIKFDLAQSNIETIEIQANTLREVALYKLNSVKAKIKGSFFIEDAGFFVDIPLDGFPGIYSSYVLRTIGNDGILKLVNNFEKSVAHFSTIIALYFKPLNRTILFEGNIKGRVSKTIKGKGGFGFDPIFIPNIFPSKTFAELPTSKKNKISHRGQAIEKLLHFLENNT